MQITLFLILFFGFVEQWFDCRIPMSFAKHAISEPVSGLVHWCCCICSASCASLFPLELPPCDRISIDEVYPEIYRFLTTDHSYGEFLNFSYLDALVCIWVVRGNYTYDPLHRSLHKTMRNITKYASPMRSARIHITECGERDIGKSMKVSLCTVPNISVSFGIGIFRKTILLPQNDFTDKRDILYSAA